MFENIKYFIRKNFTVRWHIIKTELKPGYHDPDERLLYGAMQCLVEFIEDQYAWGVEELLNGKEEIIYKEIAKADKESKPTLEDQFNYTKEAVEIYKWWRDYSTKEDTDYEEENKMLVRLINIRNTLWT